MFQEIANVIKALYESSWSDVRNKHFLQHRINMEIFVKYDVSFRLYVYHLSITRLTRRKNKTA